MDAFECGCSDRPCTNQEEHFCKLRRMIGRHTADCAWCASQGPTKTCGCRRSGVIINSETMEIERCDDCGLFETDEDAAGFVDALLLEFNRIYEMARPDETVACALDRLKSWVDLSEQVVSGRKELEARESKR